MTDRRILGDAMQLVGIVREYGPDTINHLLDTWGPEHIRKVILVLAAAVDPERTPQQLWGWLGQPIANRTYVTVDMSRLWSSLPREHIDNGLAEARSSTEQQKLDRQRKRDKRARQRGEAA